MLHPSPCHYFPPVFEQDDEEYQPPTHQAPLDPSRSQRLDTHLDSNLSARQLPFFQPQSSNPAPKRLGGLNTLGPIHPGSTWTGHQKCGNDSFAVRVTILSVDVRHSRLDGYLTMRGLCSPDEDLTTYFEGEIIGLNTGSGLDVEECGTPNYDKGVGFVTNKWGVNETQDLTHWSKFPAFIPIRPSCFPPSNSNTSGNYRYDPNKQNSTTSRHIFMRWKEKFLVPSRKPRQLTGASFDGFYYVCCSFERPEPPPPRRTRRTSSSSTTSRRSTSISSLRGPSISPPLKFDVLQPDDRVPPSPVSPRSSLHPRPSLAPALPSTPPRSFSYAQALRRNSSSGGTPTSPTSLSTLPLPFSPPRQRATSSGGASILSLLSEDPNQLIEEEEDEPRTEASAAVSEPTQKLEENRSLLGLDRQVPYTPIAQDFPLPTPAVSPAMVNSPALVSLPELEHPRESAPATQPPHSPRSASLSPSPSFSPFDNLPPPHFPLAIAEEVTGCVSANKSSWKFSTISAFYYSKSSQPFQELKLNYVDSWSGGRANLKLA